MRIGVMALLFAAAAWGGEWSVAEVDGWRKSYEAGLVADNGYLTLSGLHWLREGESSIGRGSANDVELADGPVWAGVILFDGKGVRFRDGSGVVKNLRPDTSGEPDILRFGRVQVMVIERNGKYGLRMRDPESPIRKGFTGTKWFAARREFAVRGKLIKHPYPRTVNIADVTGNVQRMQSPGVVEFVLNGQTVRLEPVISEGKLLFVFKDKTAGRLTYGAGRFLNAEIPAGDVVEMDFNKAKNPPCAYTPYTTCPMPPKQNVMGMGVEAGEKRYEGK